MIAEFQAFFSLFRQGRALTQAATWKQRSVAANALGGVLAAALLIAKGLGYDPHIDSDTVQALAGGVAAAVCVANAVMHIITDPHAGLPARAAADAGADASHDDLYRG